MSSSRNTKEQYDQLLSLLQKMLPISISSAVSYGDYQTLRVYADHFILADVCRKLTTLQNYYPAMWANHPTQFAFESSAFQDAINEYSLLNQNDLAQLNERFLKELRLRSNLYILDRLSRRAELIKNQLGEGVLTDITTRVSAINVSDIQAIASLLNQVDECIGKANDLKKKEDESSAKLREFLQQPQGIRFLSAYGSLIEEKTRVDMASRQNGNKLFEYTANLKNFIEYCDKASFPAIDETLKDKLEKQNEDLICGISLSFCKIPVTINGKLYDLKSLEKITDFNSPEGFSHPETREKIFKSQIQAAREKHDAIIKLLNNHQAMNPPAKDKSIADSSAGDLASLPPPLPNPEPANQDLRELICTKLLAELRELTLTKYPDEQSPWHKAGVAVHQQAEILNTRFVTAQNQAELTKLQGALTAAIAVLREPSEDNRRVLNTEIAACSDASTYWLKLLGALTMLAGLVLLTLSAVSGAFTAGTGIATGLAAAALTSCGATIFYSGTQGPMAKSLSNLNALPVENNPRP